MPDALENTIARDKQRLVRFIREIAMLEVDLLEPSTWAQETLILRKKRQAFYLGYRIAMRQIFGARNRPIKG